MNYDIIAQLNMMKLQAERIELNPDLMETNKHLANNIKRGLERVAKELLENRNESKDHNGHLGAEEHA